MSNKIECNTQMDIITSVQYNANCSILYFVILALHRLKKIPKKM